MISTLRTHRQSLATLLVALLAFWQIAQPLQAATFLWDSNTGTTQVQDGAGTWTSAGATWWNPATNANVVITSADIGLFGAGGTGGAITVSGNQSLLGMIFGQTATTGYSFTAAAPTTLTLGASGISVLQGAQPVTIGDANLSLVLGAAQTWANRSAGALTIGGGIANGGFGLTLNGVDGNSATGLFSLNGALTGAGGLTVGRNASATITANSGYTGATVIGNASTLTVSGAAGRISGTSGITLNGGNLTMLSVAGEHTVDRVNAAAITSNGGTITWNNPAGDAAAWAETLGALSLAKGRTNIALTNSVSGTQFLTLGTGSLTRPGGSTATIAFSGTSVGGGINRIFVTGQANTAANQIIGPWATLGTAAGAQTDYAIYTASGIAARNVANSAENTWTNTANTYTTTSTTPTLTATRSPGSLRYNAAAGTLSLGTSTFDLQTYGILNGGSGTLTVSNGTGGTGGVTTPTGGGDLYLNAGAAAITVTAPIKDNGVVNVVKAGNNAVTLSGANTYTGVTTINSGILVSGAAVAVNFDGGAASSWLGSSAATASNLVLNGGTLRYAGPTAGTTNRLFTLGEAGGTIENSAASNGTLTFAGPGSIAAVGTGDRTLILNSNGTGTFTFSPVIVNPTTGTTSVVINSTNTGPVVLLPAAANTFTGGITINARQLQVQAANGWGSNVISFGTGTSPQLDLRSNAAVNFATGFTNGLNFGNNTGIVSLSAVSASNGVTHTIGTVSIGSGTFQFNRGSNLNTNQASSLTTGAVTLSGNPTFNLNAGSGTAAPLLSLGALDDGGVARTITITGGSAGSGRQQLRFLSNATTFTAGTNIVYNGGNMGGLRLDAGNGFGTATNPGLVTFTAPTTVGGVRLLNNAATTFTTNWVLGNNNVLFDVGGTAASQATKTHTSGTLSIGTATLSLTQVNANTNNVHSLSLGATTFTGDSTFDLQNINGTGIGSLILGALNDGVVARTLTKSGAATLQLNTAATSIIAGTTLTTTAGITQIGNNTAFGSGTLNVGDGTTTGQLRIADTVTLSSNTVVTYLGGTATLGTGPITGPATGTGTINSTININAAPAADTGHFQGGGGTLSITGPIVTGGTSGGAAVIRAGNVSLGNATGNTYTSLRVNSGTTTVAVNNAIPTAANVFLADVGATATINIGAGLSQTIASGATWTLGGTGPTLENNVGTIATGTGTLVLNGTLANNTGSLATQLVTGAISFGSGSGTFNIDSGHGTSDMTVSADLSSGSLVKTGAGILTLTGTKALTDLTINGGAVVGGYGTSGVQTITIGAAGSLQLVNSLAETLTLAGSTGSLNVAGGARIGLELGAPGTSDLLTVGTGGTAATTGTITLDFYNLGALAAGTYNLLSAPSGLTTGGTTYNVGSAPLGFNYTINATDSLVQLITTANTPRFWTDSQATGSWNTLNVGPLSNFSTDAAGATNSTDAPQPTHTVIFSATSVAGPTIATTLDAAFTIDALQFLAAPVGVTAVTVAPGTGGALTLTPATSSAGIFVDTNAGTATLSAPLTTGAAQTWNVVGGGANGSALVVSGNTTFTNAVTKSGAGALTLSGTNGGAGALTLSAGTLNLNSTGALGAGTFTINGGTTINNSTGGALTMAANNPVTLNGNFTFTGTQALNLGTGAISLPTNVSITSSASNLTLGGVITETGTRSLTKLGAGALTLAADNAFSGGVNLNAGTLNLGNAGALGTGTLTIAAGTLDNTSGGAMTLADNNAQTWNGNFGFTGSNNLNLGTGAVSLGSAAGTSRTVTVTANTLEVGGIISNGAVGTGITKLGNGTLVLAGANNYTGNTVVNAGTLSLTGSLTGNGTAGAGSALQLGTVAGNSVVNIGGNISTYNNFTSGNITGANTAINMTSGTVSFTSTATADATNVVNNSSTGSYGALNITGGTMNTLGRMTVSEGAGGGVAYIGGTGTLNATGEWFMISYLNANALGSLTIGPGGTLNRTNASNYLGVFMNQATQYGILNLTGGTLITGGPVNNFGIRFGNGNGGTSNTGFLNLAAGTLQTYANVTQNVGTSTGQNAYINLAGATIQSLGALSAALPVTVTGQTVTTTLYGAIDNVGTAQDFTGGFTFDSNGFNSTIASTILAPTADGVAQSSLSVTGGSGYIGAPVVQFTGGTLAPGGAPASGYAVVSSGAVTEIVITAPGSYTVAPTVTLTGGGGTGASVAVGTLVTNTTTAGITKNGAGNLTLNGTGSTYTGPVTINGGSLTVGGGLANIGSASPLGTGNSTSSATNAASIVLNGGTLATSIGAATTTDRLFTVTELGGTLASNNGTAANTATWNNVNAIAYSGTGNRTLTFDGTNPVTGVNTFAPLIGNAGANVVTLNKTGVSNWHLTNAANAYTGGTNIAAGVLTFDAGALGTTGNITYTGSSTLRWGTGVTDDLSSRLFIADTFTGTVDTGANNVVFANAVGTTGGTTGILNKTGAGALTLNAAATHTGGTTLTAGTLNLGIAGAVGTGTLTLAGGTLDNTSGGLLTLTNAQTWSGNFTFAGTNNLTMNTGAINLTADRTVTVTAGTLTVDSIIGDTGGDFGLIKTGAGTLVLNGPNTFGADDNVSIAAGTLVVNGAAALGANTNNVFFTGSSTLRFTEDASFGAAQYFRITSTFNGTFEVDAGKTVVIAGTNTGGATNGVNNGGGSAAGSLIKTGSGTLQLSGSNSFFDLTGGFVIQQGTLSAAGTSNQVFGDGNPTGVAIHLAGGTLSFDTDTANINVAPTILEANSTVISNVATAGLGISQNLNALTVNAGGFTLNVQGGANVNGGTAGIVAGATTLNGNVTFNITDPTGGGTTQLTLGAVTGGANTATFDGNGDFVQSGIWAGAGAGITLGSTYSGLATLSQANTYSGLTTVNGGTLAFSTSGNLGDASATNDITLGGGLLQFTPATTLDLTANRQINLTSATTSTVEVTSATGVLQVTGGFATSAASNLTKTGLGTLEVTGALDLNGGNLSVNAGTMRSGLALNGVGTLTVAAGATLNMYGATSTANLNGLSLAAGSNLGFDLDTPGVNDFLNLITGTPTIGSTVSLNFNNLGGLAIGTYDLLTISVGTLNASDFVLGLAPSGFNYGFSTLPGNQTLRLTASTLNLVYWTGDQDGNWNTNNAADTNWASNASGATDLGALPVATDTLVFSATNAVATLGAITTSLNNVGVTADSLRFISAPTTPATTTVSIASGGASGILTINPASSNNGITVAGLGGDVTISAPVVAAANQTWEVDGTAPSSLTVSGDVTFTGSVTKTGGGALTLSGTNNLAGTGGVNLVAGTLNIGSATALGTGTFTVGNGTTFTNSTAGALVLNTNNVQTWGGSFTFGGSQNLDLGTGAVTLGNTLTATVNNTLTVGGGIDDGASTFALTKTGTGTLVLNGGNNYDGLTTLSAGTLTLAGNNSGAAGGVTMGAGTTLNINNNDALGTGTFTINGGTGIIDNTSGSAVTNAGNNLQTWNSSFTFTGSNALNLGTGAVTLGATPTVTVSASTLTVGGVIDGAFGLTKAGAGTLTLTGLSGTPANNYSGATILNNGTTNITTAASFNGGLTFGSANSILTASTLNLTSGATFAGALLAQTRTATANTISVSSGQTLTINGNVTIGAADPGAVASTTRLDIGGGGNLVVSTAAGGLFQVGGSTNATNSLNSIMDLTGLATASINVSATGTVRVNQPNGTNLAGNQSSLLLPTPVVAPNTPVTTITAANFNVGDNGGNGAGAGQQNSVTFGTGLTTLNVNTVNIGTGSRDLGELVYAAGNGTLQLRAADGTSRAAFNVGTGTANTGVAPGTGVTNKVDFTGHSADLFISTLTIGGQNRNTNRTDTFSFDTGILDATAVVVGDNGGTAGGASNSTWTSALNIGGGTTIIGTGGLEIARGDTAVTGSDTVSGTVNISGGTVTIANSTGLGAAVRLGNNTIAPGADVLTTTGLLNITGGTVTVSGNIIKGATTGFGSATVTLNGGTLDMSGNSIGAAGALAVTFNAQQGTLQNLNQLNAGGTLTKSTAGTLILEGTNAYTGTTSISAGTVQVGGGTLGTGSATGTLGSGSVSNSGTLTINRSNAITVANNISGTGAFIQAGAGTTILSGTNTYTGKTTISAGTLSIDSEARLGNDPGTSTADQLTLAGGTLQTTATLTIDDSNRGITVSANSSIETNSGTTATISGTILGGSANLSKGGTGTLIFTSVNSGYTGELTINAGTVGGGGGVGGNVVVANTATLSPGTSAGQFTIGGNLTVNSTGVVGYELGGRSADGSAQVAMLGNNLTSLIGSVPSSWEMQNSSLHDFISVNGASAPTFSGATATVSIFSFLGGYNPVLGDVFDLLDWTAAGNITGTPNFDFSSVTLGSGLAFNTDLFASNGIIVVTPEPSRALLLLMGLLGLLARRRRA